MVLFLYLDINSCDKEKPNFNKTVREQMNQYPIELVEMSADAHILFKLVHCFVDKQNIVLNGYILLIRWS